MLFRSGPVMLYLQNPDIKKTVASYLNHTLVQYQQIPLNDTSSVTVELLNKINAANAAVPGFTEMDTTKLHLYLNFFENNPADFFANLENRPEDTTLLEKTKSIFSFEAWIFRADKKVYFHEILHVIIDASESPGMGIPYGSVFQYGDASQ